MSATVEWLSLSGAGVSLQELDDTGYNFRWVWLDLPIVGPVAARVEAQNDTSVEVSFTVYDTARRDALIRALFTEGKDNSVLTAGKVGVTMSMLARIFGSHDANTDMIESSDRQMEPSVWLRKELAN